MTTDPSRPAPRSWRSRWLRPAAMALVAYLLAGAVLTLAQSGASAAETRFLLSVSGLVLAAAVLLEGPKRWPPLIFPAAAALALWVLPHGPLRATLVIGTGVAGLTLATVWRHRRQQRWRPTHLAAFVLALQALFAPSVLLAAGDSFIGLVRLVGPVAVAAIAAVVLGRRLQGEVAALAVASFALLGGGFSFAGALLLLGLAWALEVTREPERNLARVAAAVAVLAPAVADPKLLVITVSAAILLALPPWPAAIAALAAAAIAALVGSAPGAALTGLWPLVVLLPAVPVRGGVGLPRTLALAGFAFTAVVASPARGLALAAVAVLALVWLAAADGPPQWQRRWLLAAIALTTPLAAFPWVRLDALGALLASAGVPPGWLPAVAAVAVAALAPRLSARRRRHLIAVAIVVGCWLRFGVGREGEHRVLVAQEKTLDRNQPALEIETAAGPLARLTVESLTGHSATLEAGTVVATVRIVRQNGVVERWPLRLGAETGEWAARRPELAAAVAPEAWRCWVPANGSTFGQSYRSHWRPAVPIEAETVRIERSPTIPPEVFLVVSRVETRG